MSTLKDLYIDLLCTETIYNQKRKLIRQWMIDALVIKGDVYMSHYYTGEPTFCSDDRKITILMSDLLKLIELEGVNREYLLNCEENLGELLGY